MGLLTSNSNQPVPPTLSLAEDRSMLPPPGRDQQSVTPGQVVVNYFTSGASSWLDATGCRV
jgi:hypothetical protein